VPAGGDLVITLQAFEPYTNLRQFPWSLSVEVVDGGLVEVNRRPQLLQYLPEAPTDGYIPGFAVEHGPNLPNYWRQHESMFYLRSRNGQIYAKIRFRANASWDERGIPFSIVAVVNTNASRYLHTEPQ
jgi:hypothetical protein